MKANELDLLLILSTVIILLMVLLMALVYFIYVGKKASLILSQQKKEAGFQQELALAQIEMQELTLSYIGQELHDDIGQKLSVAKMMNNQVIPKTEGKLQDSLKEINDLLGESIQDIRNMSKTFITETIEHFGLVDSLEVEVKRIAKLNLINIELKTNKDDIDINPKVGLIIFRITQESINNALKHSKARNLIIEVEDFPEFLSLSVTDNGIGIKDQAPRNSGLNNMKKRARLINADLTVKTEPQKGTRVLLTYPKK